MTGAMAPADLNGFRSDPFHPSLFAGARGAEFHVTVTCVTVTFPA